MGGNLTVLAKGSVTGASGNDFRAKGIVGTANGGVEIGSGVTAGTLFSAFGKPAGTQPATSVLSPTGTVQINNTGGVVLTSLGKGVTAPFNLATGNNPAVLTLNHGAIVFDGGTTSSSVHFDGVTIETQSAKPVALNGPAQQVDEVVVDTADDADGSMSLMVFAP